MATTGTRVLRTALFCATALSAALPAASALGQPATPPAAEDRTIEEVVVTARRRDEALQDVPLAVSALSGAELERRRIETIAQVGQSIPNMTFQTGAPTGTGA